MVRYRSQNNIADQSALALTACDSSCCDRARGWVCHDRVQYVSPPKPDHDRRELCIRPASQLGMWAHGVVILWPVGQNPAHMGQRRKQHFVQALVTQSPVETLGKPVLLRLARGNVVPFNPPLFGPFQNIMGRKLLGVIADDHLWLTIPLQQYFQFPHNAPA